MATGIISDANGNRRTVEIDPEQLSSLLRDQRPPERSRSLVLGNGWTADSDDRGRLIFRKNGVPAAGFLSDGTLMVSGVEQNYDITSGTSSGSVVTEHNRFFRSVDSTRTTTVRLLGINEADDKVIGGERGASIVLDDTVRYPKQSGGTGTVSAGEPDTGGPGWRALNIRN